MPALKEPAHITLAEALILLEGHLPTEQAKTQLREALARRALDETPRFAFDYHEAEIDWTTGAVKFPRMKKPFCPTFSRSDFHCTFFEDAPAVDTSSPPQPREVLILKPTFMGMSVDLKELFRRAKAWWKR